MARRSTAVIFSAFVVLLAVVTIAHATFSCTVFSAQDSSPVSGALCSLRSPTETILYGSAYTDATGIATVAHNFSEPNATSYLARIGHPDYYISDQIFQVPALTTDYSLSISVTPILNTSSIRALLRWGPNPPDLDAHVFIDSLGFPSSCSEVYYSNKECLGGNGGINLDRDDTYVLPFHSHSMSLLHSIPIRLLSEHPCLCLESHYKFPDLQRNFTNSS